MVLEPNGSTMKLDVGRRLLTVPRSSLLKIFTIGGMFYRGTPSVSLWATTEATPDESRG
ncbi:MAG: hypothetical protein CM15mV29_0960 [uncultured marine virus]|nr:MAG: hypothetical protein CM15mV29_0960 [uncultured marine virus]